MSLNPRYAELLKRKETPVPDVERNVVPDVDLGKDCLLAIRRNKIGRGGSSLSRQLSGKL